MPSYPAWCTAVDQKRLDDALAAAKPPLVDDPTPWRDPVFLGGVQSRFDSDDDALRAVLDVNRVITEIVGRQPTAPVRTDVRALLDQVVVELDRLRPQTTPFAAFVQMVDAAIGASAKKIGAKMSTSRKRTPQDVERLKGERERVVLPLLDEVDWTPTRWATKAGLDPGTVLDYLAGISTPYRKTKTRLAYTLATALNRSKLQLPE